MKKLKINVCNKNCWDITSLVYKLLSDTYELEISNNPDIVFGSVRGNNEFSKYPNAIKIQINGESEEPYFDWNIDYAISMSLNSYNGKNLYCPFFVFRNFCDEDIFNNNYDNLNRDKLCVACFHNKESFRTKYFDDLNNIIQIENISGKIENSISAKLNEISKYKFNFCFENKQKPGYLTEKIYESFIGGCIPVYAGDELVSEIFNPKAFINCNGKTSEQIANEIIKINNDKDLYNKMISQQIFNNPNYINEKLDEVRNFLINIIEH